MGAKNSSPTKIKQAQEKQLLEDRQKYFLQEDNKNNNGNIGKVEEKQRNSRFREDRGSCTDGIDNNLFSAARESSVTKTPGERDREKGIRGESDGDVGDDDSAFDDSNVKTKKYTINESDPRPQALPPQHWYFTQLAAMFDGS